MMDYFTEYPSPVGTLTLASDGERIVGLWIENQKYFANTALNAARKDDLPVFLDSKRWLDDYFAGRKPDPWTLPLAPRGSAFRQQVWRTLLKIPYGQIMTYGQIAKQLNCASAQAIGSAVGHNPISIIIPCHRVVGAGGKLTGFAAGLDKKRQLLRHEGIKISTI